MCPIALQRRGKYRGTPMRAMLEYNRERRMGHGAWQRETFALYRCTVPAETMAVAVVCEKGGATVAYHSIVVACVSTIHG